MKVEIVNLKDIEQNENSRVIYKETDLSDLMFSMKNDGLLQPVGVMKTKEGGLEAVWGNRRITAAKKLGWKTITAVVTNYQTDVDRDLIGLVENMKRSQTTAAEDGRIYQSLLDRKLTVKEIATRLNVTEHRINSALEMVRQLPEEYTKRIVFNYKQGKTAAGKISAVSAVTVLNLKKSNNLTRAQTRELMDYVERRKPSQNELYKISPMLKRGVSVTEAIDKVTDMDRVVLNVYLPAVTAIKLEKKYGKRIHQVFYDYLAKHKEFKMERQREVTRANRFNVSAKKNKSRSFEVTA